MNDNEPIVSAMAAAAAQLAQSAYEEGGAALIMHPYGGPPPNAEFFLTLMREMIDSGGAATGCILIGAGPDSGMLPLLDLHPVDALHAILHIRQAGGLPKINWVTLSMDSYDYITTDPNVVRGSARAAFEAGHPDASEALKAICVAPDGPGYDVSQRYVRTDHGIEWGEPENTQALASLGDIPMLMSELVLA